MTLRKLHSLPKRLYQFITNQFFLANIPTSGQLQWQVEKTFTSSYFHSWSTGFRKRYLPWKNYIHAELHADKARKNKSVVFYCSFPTDLWPSIFLSRGCKNNLSDTCDVDLSIQAVNFHFLYILVCYVCYVFKDSQTTAYMKHVDAS